LAGDEQAVIVMTTFIFFAVFFLAGVAVGALAYRKNAEKAKAIEAKAKSLADEFGK
jgi:preprotein translocase subunit SecG